VAAGVAWFSMGTDAHSPGELANLPFGMATAALAGVRRDQLLIYRSAEQVSAWARELNG
jgi:histidinol phosphatase-like PHP family hydrolase